MKTLYEGMFILPGSLNDDDLDGALASIREEIEKVGGEVQTTTRLGKRSFARPLKKREAGHYFVIEFVAEGNQIDNLHARLKLNDNSFRVQIVKKSEEAPAAVEATA